MGRTIHLSGTSAARTIKAMHQSLEALPVTIDLPGFTGRWTEMGDWHFAYQRAAAGSNLDRVLAIYDDKACRVEHWGYVFTGRVRIQFVDGREEVIEAGEAFHTPPGHRPYMLDDTVMLQVSRKAEHDRMLADIAASREGS
jgi:hypothetical protein